MAVTVTILIITNRVRPEDGGVDIPLRGVRKSALQPLTKPIPILAENSVAKADVKTVDAPLCALLCPAEEGGEVIDIPIHPGGSVIKSIPLLAHVLDAKHILYI